MHVEISWLPEDVIALIRDSSIPCGKENDNVMCKDKRLKEINRICELLQDVMEQEGYAVRHDFPNMKDSATFRIPHQNGRYFVIEDSVDVNIRWL